MNARFPEENDGFARVAEMTRAVLPCLSHAEAKVRDVRRARRGAARGGARRRRRGDAGPGRAPLRARGVRRSADGLRLPPASLTAETAETGAETPRNLDGHLQPAEQASPSSLSTPPAKPFRI